jgi:predicted anti-sigma-YlaC factor YlaD
MTIDPCREWRGSLATAALDRDDVDSVALRAHLDGCAHCRAELDELRQVVRALPLADPSRLTEFPPAPPSELATQVVGRVAGEKARIRARRRGRFAALAAAAVLVCAIGVGVVFAERPDHRAADVATTVRFHANEPANASARLVAHRAGTEVHLTADGLDAGDWYWLWLTGADGKRIPAGSFRGTGGHVDVMLTSALPLDRAHRVWVTDQTDRVVLDAYI